MQGWLIPHFPEQGTKGISSRQTGEMWTVKGRPGWIKETSRQVECDKLTPLETKVTWHLDWCFSFHARNKGYSIQTLFFGSINGKACHVAVIFSAAGCWCGENLTQCPCSVKSNHPIIVALMESKMKQHQLFLFFLNHKWVCGQQIKDRKHQRTSCLSIVLNKVTTFRQCSSSRLICLSCNLRTLAGNLRTFSF